MDTERFGDRLRELRQSAGLSRQQLADGAGLKSSRVRDLEQGLNKPSWEVVVKLCAALGVSCEVFHQPPSPDLPPPAPGRPRKASSAQGGPPAGEPAPDAAAGKPKRRRGKGGGAK